MMNPAGLLLVLCVATLDFPAVAQSGLFSIYFAPGKSLLEEAQTARIDSFLHSGSLSGTVSMELTGFADEPGGAALNRTIATQRAVSVRAYLRASGIKEEQIGQCLGAGNVLQSGIDGGQRRVDITWTRGSALKPVAASRQLPGKVDTAAPAARPKRSMKDLGRMKEDELLVIENLLFKLSTAEMEKASLPVLNELVEVMKDYPRLKIRIEGHICCATNAKETDKLKLGYSLSLWRAEAVKNYLEEHNIAATRISSAGFGFSRPKVYPEVTLEDMNLNRRVEIRVISN